MATRPRSGQVRGRCEAAGRRAVLDLAVQGARARHQCLGLVPPAAQSGVSRPSQGIHRRSPVGATYDAFDSERYILTFDNRAFRDVAANAPYDVVEILTNSAPMAAAASTGCTAPSPPTACGRRTSSSTSSAIISRRSPTSTTPPTSRTCRRRADRAVGAERHGAPRPGGAQVAGPRQTGHAAADTVAEGGVRAGLACDAGAPPPDPRRPPRTRDGRAVPRADGPRHRAAWKALSRGRVGAFEGAITRRAASSGPKSTASCSRATRCLLRGLPPRHRTRPRHLHDSGGHD